MLHYLMSDTLQQHRRKQKLFWPLTMLRRHIHPIGNVPASICLDERLLLQVYIHRVLIFLASVSKVTFSHPYP